jgi:predicted ester cyclase
MSTEENKANARRVFEEVFNKGNLSVVDELIATNYVGHAPGMPDFKGPEGFKQYATMNRTAFPDLRMTTEDTVAEGDKVVNRWTARGTHKGDLMGIAPTGKQVTMTGMVITRYVGGKQVEAWVLSDMLGMLQQLGVVPPMGQA